MKSYQYSARKTNRQIPTLLLRVLSLSFLGTYGNVIKKSEHLPHSFENTLSQLQESNACSEFALKVAIDYCLVLMKTGQPYGSCHSYVDPNEQYDLCITKICECNGDKRCGCPAIKAYESQCRSISEENFGVGTIVDECGVCYGDGSSCTHAECTVYSSPPSSLTRTKQKFVTFDCFVHQFQGSCEYILARDCTGGLFDIHIENDSPFPNAIRTAWTRGIAVSAAGLGVIKATFSYQHTTIYMNGKQLSWPSTNQGVDGSKVVMFSEGQQKKVEIVLASTGVKIALIDQHQIVVSVPSSFRNQTCGLCGNYNGQAEDDLMLPSGESLSVANMKGVASVRSVSSYHTFGVNWTAAGKQRLILDANEVCTDPSDISYCDQKLKRRRNVEKFCKIITDPRGPFADCHRYTNPVWVYDQCVIDGCSYPGNTTMTCTAIRSYQIQCQKCDKDSFVSVPECNRPCSTLAAPFNGFKVGDGHLFEDVVKFSCNNGFILSGSSARQCQADGTWTGAPTVCTDIDECAMGTDNCDSQAVCSNTLGSFTCTCNTCYSGNGVTCTRKTCAVLPAPEQGGVSSSDNECGDHVRFECNKGYHLRGPSSLECGTESLWSGRRPICEDINECLTSDHTCDVNARCKNSRGSYECHCKQGYIGDGRTCTLVYTVTGIVKDASSGEGIGRSSVSLGSRSTITNSKGFFSFSNVPCLTYTLRAFGTGYVGNSKNITLHLSEGSSGNRDVRAEIVLTRILTSGTWKVIITWGEEPRDVDAYMDVPGGCRVSYAETERNCFSGSSNVSLDHDEKRPYGVETITIHEGVVGGIYGHYVHVYSDGSTFSSGNVTAELYNGDSKVSTIVSPTGTSTYWDTFRIDTARRHFYVINRLRRQQS